MIVSGVARLRGTTIRNKEKTHEERAIPRDVNRLSDGAGVSTTGGSTAVVVDGDLSLLSGNGVGNSEGVHCSEDECALKD